MTKALDKKIAEWEVKLAELEKQSNDLLYLLIPFKNRGQPFPESYKRKMARLKKEMELTNAQLTIMKKKKESVSGASSSNRA